ncbi:MAG: hypothetical protein ACJA1Z_001685 [Patiriisocius sp.]
MFGYAVMQMNINYEYKIVVKMYPQFTGVMLIPEKTLAMEFEGKRLSVS